MGGVMGTMGMPCADEQPLLLEEIEVDDTNAAREQVRCINCKCNWKIKKATAMEIDDCNVVQTLM